MRSKLDLLFASTLSAVLAIGLYAFAIGARVEAAYTPLFPGAILFSNTSTCPAGWTEFTSARGASIVGLVSGGTLNTLVGTALTNLENRAVGQHTHTNSQASTTQATTTQATTTASQGTHVHANSVTTWSTTFATPGGGSEASGFQTVTSTPAASAGAITVTNGAITNGAITNGAITVNNTGSVAGTNAPYIQLLVCSKS